VSTSLLQRALISGTVSSLATSLVASLVARRSGRSAAEPVNAVGSHLAGAHAMWRKDFSLKSTLPGMAINLGGCLFWAGVMERWVQQRPLGGTADALRRGGIAAALAYTVDYHVLPRRLRPGYERKLSPAQLLAVYSVLSITFPLRAWLSLPPADGRAARGKQPNRPLVERIPIG
jgi:hypothetical protein